jgi:hypothetical protein
MDDADDLVRLLFVDGQAGVLMFVELEQHMVERRGHSRRPSVSAAP